MFSFGGHCGIPDMSDQHLAQYILVSSMRKLDQGRRSKTGIQLERGLLIAVTALKARQTLWEQDLKLRGFYNTNNVYGPVYTNPVVSTPPIEKSSEINVYQSDPNYFKPESTENISNTYPVEEKTESKPDIETEYYDENEMDDSKNEDSMSDGSTDEELLQDEEMNRMVISTISDSEPEHWRFLLDDTEIESRQSNEESFDSSNQNSGNSQTWTTLEVASNPSSTSESLPLHDYGDSDDLDSSVFPSNKRKRRYSFSDCKSLYQHRTSPSASILT